MCLDAPLTELSDGGADINRVATETIKLGDDQDIAMLQTIDQAAEA